MNNSNCKIPDANWSKLLSELSPNKINALEKSLKEYHYQSSNNNQTSDESINDFDENIKKEPVTLSTKSFFTGHKTKNRGLTYENGRRNLKLENCTPDEMDRRSKRRERNRLAAAKCREKRQMQVEILKREVEALRTAECRMRSALEHLSNEEELLKQKLISHNCILTNSQNGDINIIIPNNQIVQNSHSFSRPKSLPVNCQNCTNVPPQNQSDLPILLDKNSTPLEQLIGKDSENTLTPLLSPDTYNLLKCQIKSEPDTTTTPINKMSLLLNESPCSEVNPIISTVPTTMSNCNFDSKSVFSWNNQIVDELSMNCGDPNSNSTNYLTTPTVDLPSYASNNYQHNSYNNLKNS